MNELGGDIRLITFAIALLTAALLIWALVRIRRARRLNRGPVLSEPSGQERPYVRSAASAADPTPGAERGKSVADEYALAATDVAGDVLGIARESDGNAASAAAGDDLQRLKGVGPKLASTLRELGITRFEHLAGLSANEVALLDERLGAFRGRIARDRLVEQASYLERGDTEGFEAAFGKLGSS